MAKCEIKAGSTDQTIDIFVNDSSVTTGAGLTGLAFNTSSLTCYYRKGATGTPTALTLATQTVGGAHSDGGFVAVDGTNCPGQYRLDLSDTIVATAGMVTLHLRGAANMVPVLVEIEVVAVDKFDSVRGGMTALPNAAAEAAGGLYTRGTGAGQLSQSANGELGVATLAKTLTTYTGNTPQTGDVYAIANSGTHGNAALKTLIDAVDNFVDTEVADIQSRLPAALGANGNIKADVRDYSGVAGTFSGGRPEVNTTHAAGTAWGSGAITAGSIATDAITAAKLAADAGAEIATAVWASATRILTAGTNIALAKGVGVTGFNDLDAAGVRTAVGLGSANLDTQLNAVYTTAGLAYADTQSLLGQVGSLDTDIGSIITTLGTPAGISISADILTIDNLVDDLETRLSATRAGYLDNLSGGAVALEATSQTVLADTNELQTDWANGGRLDLLIDAILADTDSLDTTKITTARAAVLSDWIDGGRLDLILDARASQTSVDDLPTNAELTTALGTADDAVLAAITSLSTDVGAIPTNAELTAALAASWTTALTEPSARADGSPGSPSQYLHELLASQQEKSISGTTMLWKKLNGSTTLATMTFDSASNPTSVTRSA